MSGYSDSNTGPSGPKPDALANCATPRMLSRKKGLQRYPFFRKKQNNFQKIIGRLLRSLRRRNRLRRPRKPFRLRRPSAFHRRRNRNPKGRMKQPR